MRRCQSVSQPRPALHGGGLFLDRQAKLAGIHCHVSTGPIRRTRPFPLSSATWRIRCKAIASRTFSGSGFGSAATGAGNCSNSWRSNHTNSQPVQTSSLIAGIAPGTGTSTIGRPHSGQSAASCSVATICLLPKPVYRFLKSHPPQQRQAHRPAIALRAAKGYPMRGRHSIQQNAAFGAKHPLYYRPPAGPRQDRGAAHFNGKRSGFLRGNSQVSFNLEMGITIY